jgi:ribosome-binding factor A
MRERRERVRHLLRDLAAEFINAESDTRALITVTDVDISADLEKATIFVSIYPERDEEETLHFLKRKRHELRLFVSSHTRLKSTPAFDFEIDEGEKNRQRIDTLLSH